MSTAARGLLDLRIEFTSLKFPAGGCSLKAIHKRHQASEYPELVRPIGKGFTPSDGVPSLVYEHGGVPQESVLICESEDHLLGREALGRIAPGRQLIGLQPGV